MVESFPRLDILYGLKSTWNGFPVCRQTGIWPESLVLYRMRPRSRVQWMAECWARPIQPFEGSRRWGERLCKFNGPGIVRRGLGKG